MQVTAVARPRTIHDFYGFPPELYAVSYPAPGSPGLAGRVRQAIKAMEVRPDTTWGLDHGVWSALKRLFPAADIPVVQLGLDRAGDSRFDYGLGRQLRELREEGVLIIGSGNIVHKLLLAQWGDTDQYSLGSEDTDPIAAIYTKRKERCLKHVPSLSKDK